MTPPKGTIVDDTEDSKCRAGVSLAVTLGIGTFLTTIIDFILVALVIFLMIKAINRFHKKKEEAPAPEEPKGPTSEELLTEIRDLLKEKNQ